MTEKSLTFNEEFHPSSFSSSSNVSNANARDKKRALNSSSGQSTYSITKINVESETSSSNIIKKQGNNRGLKYGTSTKEKSLSCGEEGCEYVSRFR